MPERRCSREHLCLYLLGIHLFSFIARIFIWFRLADIQGVESVLFIACNQALVSLLLERVTFFVRAKKVTQKTRPGRSCYAYPQPSSLPTGRLDSPSRLDKTRLTVRGQSTLPVKLSSASLTGNCPPHEVCRGTQSWQPVGRIRL